MIINKVILTNFRNHKYKEINFSKGVNLLYGQNGAGKTSILEAIGYALFGGKIRTNNLFESVTEGEKKAKIYVEFTTDDDTVYAVEKPLPTGSGKLFSLDNRNVKITGKGEIQEKLWELLGMKINSESFFSNIIVASQNKITDIFTGSLEERRKRFDKLFDTEIYRQMSEGYIKEMSSELSNEITKKSDKLDELKNQIIEPEILSNQLINLQNQLNSFRENKVNIEVKYDSAQKEINELRDYKNQIESTNQLLINNHDRRNDTESRIRSLIAELENANQSNEIVISCKYDYNKYISINDEISKIEKQISELEKIAKKNDKLRNKFKDNENELGSLNTELSGKKERIAELKIEEDKLNKSLVEFKDDISKIQNDINSTKTQFQRLDEIKSKVLNHEKSIAQTEKSINDFRIEISSNENNISKEDELKSNIEKLRNEIAELKTLFEKKRELEKYSAEKNSRLNENNEAHIQLAGGICPFLTENCLNIGQGSSITQYFTSKEEKLKNEISEIENELSKLSEIESNDKKLRKELSRAEQLLQNNESYRNKIDKLKEQIFNSETLLENLNLKIELVFSENLNFFEEINLLVSEKNTVELQKCIDEYSTQLKQFNTILNEKEKQRNSLSIEIQNKNSIISESEKRILEILNKITVLSENQELLSTEIQSNDEVLSPLDAIKQSAIEFKTSRDALNENYQSYIKNLKSAERIPQIEDDIKAANEIVSQLNQRDIEIIVSLAELQTKYSEDIFIQKSANLEIVKSELREVESKLYNISIEESVLKSKIDDNNNYLINYNSNISQKSHLEKKQNLLTILRTNLKSMGQIISQKFIERIQILATDNYRLISGRNESIVWKSDMSDAYQVALKLNNGNLRNFELLSGGEQMMVAISLRASMNSLLSNSKFVIFDEPTVNLDTERRKALSESLNHILNSLDQAIIVTHDDAFMETANNIIEL